ncbi:MAG: ubiquinone/menaquinone biosynthesis methyltransferase [Spirochaetota bacterium]
MGQEPGKGELVRGIFNDIADGYDGANRLMSLGRDARWRAIVASHCALSPGGSVLDLCCGTGELSFALAGAAPGVRVTGLDFSSEMLARAHEKNASRGLEKQVTFIEADATVLPFPDASFDATTVGWGLRNVPDLGATLREMVRVTRPGGRVISIDMGHPSLPLIAWVYWKFSSLFVPAVGSLVARNAPAYQYLHESSKAFIDQTELAQRFKDCSLTELHIRNFMGGAVALVEGRKPSIS